MPAYEQGWKDVVLVKGKETVQFIAKFDDFADATHPFMYHCHISLHEDEGMMGQFVVTNPTNKINTLSTAAFEFKVMPVPATDRINIVCADPNEVYYITITDQLGRTKMMLPQPDLRNGIDISSLATGIYFVQLMDKATKQISIQKFIKS